MSIDRETEPQQHSNEDEANKNWSSLISSNSILDGLASMGFSSPTPIQSAVIPEATIHKKDVIGAAETGSGKTLAFAIPILERWLSDGRQNLSKEEVNLFALIVAPTRELAIQIKNVFKQLSAKIDEKRPFRTIAIVGGMSEQKQQRLLKSRPDVIIGTPGRLWALKQTGEEHLEDLSGLKILVVDEIDRMLEQGHFEELKHIVRDIHRCRKEYFMENPSKERSSHQLQTLIFSATLTFTHHITVRKDEKPLEMTQSQVDSKQKVKKIAQAMCMRKGGKFLAIVDLSTAQKTPKTLIECRMNCMDLLQKDTNLFYLLQRYGGRTLVFGNSIMAIRRLQALLRKLTPPGGTLPRILHGKMKEKDRLKSVEKFEASNNAILMATDVAARGLDFQSVQNIIHYQTPKTTESYIHRSGRTARASKAGLSVLFVDPLDLSNYQKICRNMNKDEDLEVLAVDDEKLMENCRQLVELATEAESLEHRVRKRRDREQWFRRLAKEAELDWDDEDGAAKGEDDEPRSEQTMERRRKLLERRLKELLMNTVQAAKTSRDGNETKPTDDEGNEQANMRKRLKLERGTKKWFKRPKTSTPKD